MATRRDIIKAVAASGVSAGLWSNQASGISSFEYNKSELYNIEEVVETDYQNMDLLIDWDLNENNKRLVFELIHDSKGTYQHIEDWLHDDGVIFYFSLDDSTLKKFHNRNIDSKLQALDLETDTIIWETEFENTIQRIEEFEDNILVITTTYIIHLVKKDNGEVLDTKQLLTEEDKPEAFGLDFHSNVIEYYRTGNYIILSLNIRYRDDDEISLQRYTGWCYYSVENNEFNETIEGPKEFGSQLQMLENKDNVIYHYDRTQLKLIYLDNSEIKPLEYETEGVFRVTSYGDIFVIDGFEYGDPPDDALVPDGSDGPSDSIDGRFVEAVTIDGQSLWTKEDLATNSDTFVRDNIVDANANNSNGWHNLYLFGFNSPSTRSPDDGLTIVDYQDGSVVWEENNIEDPLILDNGCIYYHSSDKSYIVNSQDGTVEWEGTNAESNKKLEASNTTSEVILQYESDKLQAIDTSTNSLIDQIKINQDELNKESIEYFSELECEVLTRDGSIYCWFPNGYTLVIENNNMYLKVSEEMSFSNNQFSFLTGKKLMMDTDTVRSYVLEEPTIDYRELEERIIRVKTHENNIKKELEMNKEEIEINQDDFRDHEGGYNQFEDSSLYLYNPWGEEYGAIAKPKIIQIIDEVDDDDSEPAESDDDSEPAESDDDSEPAESDDDSEPAESDDDSIPGFGIYAALVGLTGLGYIINKYNKCNSEQ